jgi:hypothetical protein
MDESSAYVQSEDGTIYTEGGTYRMGPTIVLESSPTSTIHFNGVPYWPDTVDQRLAALKEAQERIEQMQEQVDVRLRKLEGGRWTEEELIEMEKTMPDALPVVAWRATQAISALASQILSAWFDLFRQIAAWFQTWLAAWEMGDGLMDGDMAALLPNYSACTLIMPDGTTCLNKSVKTERLMTVEQALERLRGNQSAWVVPGDVEAVLGELAGKA